MTSAKKCGVLCTIFKNQSHMSIFIAVHQLETVSRPSVVYRSLKNPSFTDNRASYSETKAEDFSQYALAIRAWCYLWI